MTHPAIRLDKGPQPPPGTASPVRGKVGVVREPRLGWRSHGEGWESLPRCAALAILGARHPLGWRDPGGSLRAFLAGFMAACVVACSTNSGGQSETKRDSCGCDTSKEYCVHEYGHQYSPPSDRCHEFIADCDGGGDPCKCAGWCGCCNIDDGGSITKCTLNVAPYGGECSDPQHQQR